MTDGTEDHKPWDIEKYRGVRRYAERKKDWEQEDDEEELVLHASPGTSTTSPSSKASPKYDENGPSLFWLALRTSLLTIITLGIYRFWMTAALRRHYWNAIRIQGDPLEYTGTGLEKLLGFLIAIIVLAVYLGTVNLGLAFIGLSYFEGNPAALNITILAAVPFIFYATYRARRYIMARTRWRGIRFGLDRGAFGYTARAIWYWFLTLITGGLLYPFQQFRLAKFVTDRSYFGDLKFHQNGSWMGLFAYWVWIYVVLGLMVLAFWGMAADPGNPSTQVIGGLIAFVGYISLFVMFMRYEIVAFRYMWSNRTLGNAAFQSDVSPGSIISVYVVGTLLVGICTMLVLFALALAVGLVVIAGLGLDPGSVFDQSALNRMAEGGGLGQAAPLIAGGVLTYLVAIAFSIAFTQIFITRPILQRKAETMVIHNVLSLTQSRQRAHDHAAEAGGFADALGVDMGAGF